LREISKIAIGAWGGADAEDDVLHRLREKWAGKFRYC